MARIAAVTMVRDDPFFLDLWLRHYGRELGRERCYVVNHGHGARVAAQAYGCNVIGIPGDPHRNFDMKRWRLLNNIMAGLLAYHDHVIVGDVDELVVVDPAAGMGLAEYVAAQPRGGVLTPLGLEVIHRRDLEPEPVAAPLLGHRMHVRLAPHYAKPCVLSTATKIARGGHFTQADRLQTPEHLYLLHLKFCDFDLYRQTMDARNATAAAAADGPKDAAIGRHWFAQARGDDAALFDGFARLPMAETFDPAPIRAAMHATWGPRGTTGFWQFDRPDAAVQYRLPKRFTGLV